MGYLEDMLVRNGVIYRAPDGSSFRIEGSLVSNSLVVRDSSGWVTHRIERASNGVDLVVRSTKTGLVETRISASSLF
ncbi:hypothetical protein IKT64_00860 [Candidatus Saccharibacteria bacterium]|jgi:hypothetical protein|nr:hypothetical protein [Candidatus Saccharibacteria bacterium]